MTQKLSRGWKVLRHDRLSVVMCEWSGRVQYKKRRRVFPAPNCGPLCVFSTREAAHAFFYMDGGQLLVPCTYMPSKKETVWTNEPGHEDSIYLLPRGTKLASFVTCLE